MYILIKFHMCNVIRYPWITTTDLVLHTVLHRQKSYHSFRLKFLIKRIAELQNRGTEYFGLNIKCVLYMMYTVGYVRNGDQFEL